MEFFKFHSKRNPYFRNQLWSCLKMKEEACLWASSQAAGRDFQHLEMCFKKLIRIWKTVHTDSLWLHPLKSVWQSSGAWSWASTNYNQSLVIWLYKMISDSTEKMKGNYFSNLPVNWALFTPSFSFNAAEKYGFCAAFGKTQHIRNSPMLVFDFMSIS